MIGFGGMVCVDLKGGQDAAYRAFDRLGVFQRAASLGGVESLCSLPILTSQYGLTDEELKKAGVTRGMMRLSVGLEDPEDLIADLHRRSRLLNLDDLEMLEIWRSYRDRRRPPSLQISRFAMTDRSSTCRSRS